MIIYKQNNIMPHNKGKSRRRTAPRSKKAQVKTVVRQELKKQLKSELEYLDTVQNSTYAVSSDVPQSFALSYVAQGDDEGDRNGNDIGVTGMDLYIAAFRDAASTSHDRMTIALIRSNIQDAGNPPVWNDVFAYNGSHTAVVPFRKTTSGKESLYNVIKMWQLDLGDDTGNPKTTRTIYYKKRWKNPQAVTFNGVNGSSAHAGVGHYYLIATSDVLSAASEPYIQYACRLYFRR